jgi:hypothetical protein
MISATDDKWLQVPNNYGTACELYILHLSEQIISVRGYHPPSSQWFGTDMVLFII